MYFMGILIEMLLKKKVISDSLILVLFLHPKIR